MLDLFIEKQKQSQGKSTKELMQIPNLFRYKMLVILHEICEIAPIP
jgi:hypothetical protein